MPPPEDNRPGDADTQRKIGFLRNPGSYPVPATSVEVIETHFAWVFLTDAHAWKLKKPIRAQVIDYRRLADRAHFCREELRLNRRLADWVYLDVVPLTEDAAGRLALAGAGRVVDWLVKMVRLPADDMLDRIIDRGELEFRHLERIARELGHFYAGLAPERLDADAYLSRLFAQSRQQEIQIRDIDGALAAEPWQDLLADQRRFMDEYRDTLAERAESGLIVEAHGDLRPEHIYLGERFAIIDCLEFSRDLRIQDSAEEIAFLALECELAAGTDAARSLISAFAAVSGDEAAPSLMAFYMSRRATVRAILSAWHLADPRFDRGYYIAQTDRYRDIAAAYAAEALSG